MIKSLSLNYSSKIDWVQPSSFFFFKIKISSPCYSLNNVVKVIMQMSILWTVGGTQVLTERIDSLTLLLKMYLYLIYCTSIVH